MSCLQNTHMGSLHWPPPTPFSSSRRTSNRPEKISARTTQDKNVPNGRHLGWYQRQSMARNIGGHRSKCTITALCNSPARSQLRSRLVSSGATTARRMTSCCKSHQRMCPVTASSYRTRFWALTRQLHASFLGVGLFQSLEHLDSKTVGNMSARHRHASLMAGPIASISGVSLPSAAAGALALTAAKLQALAVAGSSRLAGLAELYMPYVPAVVAPLASACSKFGTKFNNNNNHNFH